MYIVARCNAVAMGNAIKKSIHVWCSVHMWPLLVNVADVRYHHDCSFTDFWSTDIRYRPYCTIRYMGLGLGLRWVTVGIGVVVKVRIGVKDLR